MFFFSRLNKTVSQEAFVTLIQQFKYNIIKL